MGPTHLPLIVLWLGAAVCAAFPTNTLPHIDRIQAVPVNTGMISPDQNEGDLPLRLVARNKKNQGIWGTQALDQDVLGQKVVSDSEEYLNNASHTLYITTRKRPVTNAEKFRPQKTVSDPVTTDHSRTRRGMGMSSSSTKRSGKGRHGAMGTSEGKGRGMSRSMGMSMGRSRGTSRGTSMGTSRGTSMGMSMGMSMGRSMGMSSAMGMSLTTPPSETPTPAPTAMPTMRSGSILLVRPFCRGDFDLLLASFNQWEGNGLPCSLVPDSRGNLVPVNGVVDMILYSARPLTLSMSTALWHVKTATSLWRQCFGKIEVLEGNLTEADDVYRPSNTDADWNRGPNTQFYLFVQWMRREYRGTPKLFFYMESDTEPHGAAWLDALQHEVVDAAPFAILGSRYEGHNWRRYLDLSPPVIPDKLRYHLNGNAIYNISHEFVQVVVDTELTAPRANVARSSYDVRFCEVALEQLGYTPNTLPLLGYKQTTLLSNLASTLVVPARVPSGALVVHGAMTVQPWSARCARRHGDSSMTLVVTDWGEGADLAKFMSALSAVRASPFTEIKLVTQDISSQAAAVTAYPILDATTRDWSSGGAEWDFCTADVTTTWFMAVNTYFSPVPTLEIPTSVQGYKPLIPYKSRDSQYCDCVCKDRVDNAASICPSYTYDIAPEHAVFHLQTRNRYCAATRRRSSTPSVNGYFAYVLSSSKTTRLYQFYDRERYGVIESFDIPPSPPSECQNQVDGSNSNRDRERRNESVICTAVGGSFLCTADITSTEPTTTATRLDTDHSSPVPVLAATRSRNIRVSFYLDQTCDSGNVDQDEFENNVYSAMAMAGVNTSRVHSVCFHCGSVVGEVAFPERFTSEAEFFRTQVSSGAVLINFGGSLNKASLVPPPDDTTVSTGEVAVNASSYTGSGGDPIDFMLVLLIIVILIIILAIVMAMHRRRIRSRRASITSKRSSQQSYGSLSSYTDPIVESVYAEISDPSPHAPRNKGSMSSRIRGSSASLFSITFGNRGSKATPEPSSPRITVLDPRPATYDGCPQTGEMVWDTFPLSPFSKSPTSEIPMTNSPIPCRKAESVEVPVTPILFFP